ncbi:hypothetical protein SERLA73DRAFT_192248 [Serpula lacrymans var. lacrymans S7.3]|uniref:Uncharacterized protein n=1 Tax=Serpula lacrymans var. lacrymans (strain S7.3) TaxID=936435 RepID=F8QJE7_SERL3|nr:hypothetical protein SERLA73DRAFT_192248 [Serpula lacrymans var. lacrymans S7.3]
MMSWEDAVKKGQGKTISVSIQFLYCQSGILKKICVHKNDSKIKINHTVNEFPWPYQWTGCIGPPGQTREGGE